MSAATTSMDAAKRLLYERVIKKYTMQEVAKHKTIQHKNLYELISRFPGHGAGFKVYKKFSPETCFYHIRKVDLYVSD